MDQQTNSRAEADQAVEIDLLDLLGYYLSHLPLLIAMIAAGALIAGFFTIRFIPKRYTATSRMYMISASSDSVVDLSDLNIGASLSNDYVELMKSRPVLEDVIERLGLDYTYEQLSSMISLNVVSNTRIVRIAVTSTDPREAMDIANQMAWTSKSRLPLVMDAPAPTIAEEAVLPKVKSSPSLSRNVMLGSLLLLAAALAVLTFTYLMDDTVKTAEDVEREFGVMPLSTIPEGTIEGMGGHAEEDKRRFFRGKKRKKKKKKGAGK